MRGGEVAAQNEVQRNEKEGDIKRKSKEMIPDFVPTKGVESGPASETLEKCLSVLNILFNKIRTDQRTLINLLNQGNDTTRY